jgi:hypothetical protein
VRSSSSESDTIVRRSRLAWVRSCSFTSAAKRKNVGSYAASIIDLILIESFSYCISQRYALDKDEHFINRGGTSDMTDKQAAFLKNLTAERAERLLRKFNYDPGAAYEAGHDAYHAFSLCWETVHPGEYIQRAHLAGGVRFNFLSVTP